MSRIEDAKRAAPISGGPEWIRERRTHYLVWKGVRVARLSRTHLGWRCLLHPAAGAISHALGFTGCPGVGISGNARTLEQAKAACEKEVAESDWDEFITAIRDAMDPWTSSD